MIANTEVSFTDVTVSRFLISNTFTSPERLKTTIGLYTVASLVSELNTVPLCHCANGVTSLSGAVSCHVLRQCHSAAGHGVSRECDTSRPGQVTPLTLVHGPDPPRSRMSPPLPRPRPRPRCRHHPALCCFRCEFDRLCLYVETGSAASTRHCIVSSPFPLNMRRGRTNTVYLLLILAADVLGFLQIGDMFLDVDAINRNMVSLFEVLQNQSLQR